MNWAIVCKYGHQIDCQAVVTSRGFLGLPTRGTIAGHAQATRKGEGRFSLNSISVIPSYQHQGIGTALVNEVQNAAASAVGRPQQPASVCLEVPRPLNQAIPFYQSIGFTPIPKLDGTVKLVRGSCVEIGGQF